MTKKLTIALAGNPNAGKTTLFNAITGARQHIANYPGVTVEKKSGQGGDSRDTISRSLISPAPIPSTVLRGPTTPFVMELPPYRVPTIRGLLIHAWERTWQYMKKAGTIILGVSIVLWAMMTFP